MLQDVVVSSSREYLTDYLASLGIPSDDIVKILEYAASDGMIIDRRGESWIFDNLLVNVMKLIILDYAWERTENFNPSAVYAHLFQRG